MAGWSMDVHVLCVHVLCVLVACTMVSAKYKACPDGTSNADSKMTAIDTAFGRSNSTDVVFLLDRSRGIYREALDNTKKAIRTLMDYLMLRRLLYLHKDYTRVAVVSFGVQSMVEFDGISSDSDTVHACNFDDKLGNIGDAANETLDNTEAALKVCILYSY